MLQGAIIGAIVGILVGIVIAIIGQAMPGKECPKCGEKFPKFRKPANKRQAMWGGATCLKCGCEVDRIGKIVQG